MVPRGARCEYGLLGAQFHGTEGTALRVEVSCSHDDGVSWPESLGASIDDVRLGLPHEYAEAISVGVGAYAIGLFPPGRLTFTKAAYGLIGSSPRFFSLLAKCVVTLMHAGPLGEDEMTSLIGRCLVEQRA